MGNSVTISSTARQKWVTARVIACGVLLVLPSCRIPRLREGQAGPALPADFNGRTSPESSALLGVEEFYKDPVLSRMIAEALDGNQELKILEEEIQVARNEIRARQGAFLPFVSFRGGTGLETPSLFTPAGAAEDQLTAPGGRGFPDPLGNFMFAADLLWRIDIWRELRNARDAAEQRYIAAIERRDFFVTQMVAEIAENYYELMALDQWLQNLDQIIELQQQSLKAAEANKEAGRGTELAVQRFQAEIRKNQSEKQVVTQQILQAENRINFLLGRFPRPVEREPENFLDLTLQAPRVGVPAQLLLYRADIRQAERELAAAELDVLSARARFFPRVDLTASVGYAAFDPKFLFDPEALIGHVAGELVQPLINKKAIRAEYLGANARELQALYNYQRTILNAFTEVVNRLSRAENFRRSVEIKKQQLASLETAVDVATRLFQTARVEYIEVLLAQRDLLEARRELIETKKQQLSAVVNAYQAVGGGVRMSTSTQNPDEPGGPPLEPVPGESPLPPLPGDG